MTIVEGAQAVLGLAVLYGIAYGFFPTIGAMIILAIPKPKIKFWMYYLICLAINYGVKMLYPFLDSGSVILYMAATFLMCLIYRPIFR